MKVLKKAFIGIFLFVFILTLYSVSVLASSETYNGTCGENLIWTLDIATGKLEITGTGAMEDYAHTSSGPWQTYKENINTVTIGDGVTTVGNSAFRGCDKISDITLGNNIEVIGDGAFYKCNKLKEIVIPDSVTSIGETAFFLCDDLERVTIGNNVVDIGNSAFYCCDGLTDVTIPDSVENIGNWAFYGCRGITNLNIGNQVSMIGDYAFCFCANITSIIIPDSVKSVGNYAFEDCQKAETITIGNNVISIGSRAFSNCRNVAQIYIPESIREIGDNAFSSCYKLENIQVAENNDYYSSDEYGVLFNESKTMLIQYPVGNTRISYVIVEGVEEIGQVAFTNNHNINMISIHETVKVIGDNSFYNCVNLTDVYFYGTEEKWNQYVPTGNSLNNATIHFNVANRVANTEDMSVMCSSDYFFENPGATFVTKNANENDKNFMVREELTKIHRIEMFVADENNEKIENVTGEFFVRVPIPDNYRDCSVTVVHWTAKLASGHEEFICTPKFDAAKNEYYIEFITTSFSQFDICINFGFEADSDTLVYQETKSIPATTDSGLSVIYTSSNPEIAAVDENGNVTATGKGIATITAAVELENGEKLEDTCEVTVVNSFEIPDDFSFTQSSLELIYNNTATLSTTADMVANVTYTSSNPKVVTVDENGNLTTTGRGTATITASFTDDFGEVYEATCEVTVKFTFWQWIIYILFLGFLWY